jgi:hypothetical protein
MSWPPNDVAADELVIEFADGNPRMYAYWTTPWTRRDYELFDALAFASLAHGRPRR